MAQTLDLVEQRRHRLINMLHTWLLAAGSLALLAGSAWIFAGVTGLLWAAAFGVFTTFAVRRISPQMVLKMYKAEPVSAAEFPLGHDIINELAGRAGLPAVPKLHVVPSELLNAFAVGRKDDSAIAITDALARTLTPRELAGVLAHEMSHIANEDLKVMAFADMVSRFTSMLSTAGLFSALFNLFGLFGLHGSGVPWSAVIVLMAAPTIGGLLQMALSRTREFDADLGAAELTGDPDGLASALRKLEHAQRRQWEGLVLPGGRIPDPSMLRSHPATAERIARLMALKGDSAAADTHRTVSRPSPLPRIRQREPLALSLAGGTENMPCCSGSLNAPQGRPRLRISRGGVWW